MKTQRETVSYINEETSRVIDELKDSQRPSRASAIFRLVFFPPLVFFSEFFGKGAFLRGREGLKEAVNRWAFSFSLEGKRYERFFGDVSELEKRSRDYL